MFGSINSGVPNRKRDNGLPDCDVPVKGIPSPGHDGPTFRVDGEVVHARIEDGTIHSRLGPANRPDVTIDTDGQTLLGLALGNRQLTEAVRAGCATLDGDGDLVAKMHELFPSPPAITAPANQGRRSPRRERRSEETTNLHTQQRGIIDQVQDPG